jgi:release factor glutamine methyltransferase
MKTDPWTVARLLTWTTDCLNTSGSESPQLDAELLLATARKCERVALYTASEDVVPDETRAVFQDLINRRAEGTPVPYLIGEREFFSLSLQVTPDVFIPRPETEYVVMAALEALEHPANASARVADVGTGSGAIAIAIAKQAAGCRVIAIDASRAALDVARKNAAHHQVDRIDFVAGDLLTPLASERTLSIVASNPPYVSDAEYARLPASVREHEPRRALVGGQKGTEIIERLIPQAAERLKAGGTLILEVSPKTVTAVLDLLAADGRFEVATTSQDLTGHVRLVQARRRE